MKQNIRIKCACGCGKYRWKYCKRKGTSWFDSKPKKYLPYHFQRKKGRKKSCETKRKIKQGILNSKKFKKNRFSKKWKENASKSKKGKGRSKNSCLKQSETMQGHFVSKRTKKKIAKKVTGEKNGMYGRTLEKNPMWKNGVSFEPYGLEFNKELKTEIRKRDNFICQECGKNGFIVHHIDYNKKNNKPCNLITLCRSCHGKTNHNNRIFWTKHFQTIIKAYKHPHT